MTGSFLHDLMIGGDPAAGGRMFPVVRTFPRLESLRDAEPAPEKLLRPTYSYDWTEIDEIRDGRLCALDDMMAQKRKQLMDQLIAGVLYDFGTTEEKGSTFIWARPVRVHPDYAPHVMAWGQCLTGLVNQP